MEPSTQAPLEPPLSQLDIGTASDHVEFLDKVYYQPIETIISATKKPELRPILGKMFLNWLAGVKEIRDATELDGITGRINHKAKTVVQAINVFNEREASAAEVKKATFRKGAHEKRMALLSGLEPAILEPAIDDKAIGDDINRMIANALALFDRVLTDSDRVTDSITRLTARPLKRAILSFKLRRVFRRCLREVERFLLTIVVFGVLLSSAVSESAKLLFQHHWLILLICAAIWQVLKEYRISPWLRKRRLEKQRSDLILFFNSVFGAEMRLFVTSVLRKDREPRPQQSVTNVNTGGDEC
jgi:hypothetical protein